MKKYELTDNAYDIIEKNKANILELILNQGSGGTTPSVGGGIPWLDEAGYADITDFGNNAKNYEVVKYNINADGTNNNAGFLFLIKTSSGIKEFRTYGEIKDYVDYHLLLANKKIDVNSSTINEIIDVIQTIENTWTGSENAHGIDLATLTGDKGAFDLTPSEKLFATFQIEGLKPEVKQEIEIIQGTHTVHLTSVDRTTDVSFQIQTAPIADGKHLLAISDFASHGTVVKTENDIKLVELMQNPKSGAVIGSLGSGTLEDIYKSARGIAVDGEDKNYANIKELGKLMKQNFITNGEKMVKTQDTITLTEYTPNPNGVGSGKIEYTDTESGILTGKYNLNITDAGVLITYTYGSRANIWNRLSAWLSSFGGTSLHNNTSVAYNFNSTHIYKFTVNQNQTYSITIDDKFEANELVKYLTFKTDGQLHGAGGVNFTTQAQSADGYQIKLSEVMSASHPDAEIIFTFPNALNVGDKLLNLEYTSSPQLLAERHSIAIKNNSQKITTLENESRINIGKVSGTIFNGFTLGQEYTIPNGLKIFTDFIFGGTDATDLNAPRTFKVDLNKKSVWEDIAVVDDMGYGDAVQFHLNGYHDETGAITKFKLTNPNNVDTGYFPFTTQRITIEAITTNELINTELINKTPNSDLIIHDLTKFEKANALYAELDKLGTGKIVRIIRKRGGVIYLAMIMQKASGKLVETDATNTDFYSINIMGVNGYSFLGGIKIPNKDEDWDTTYGAGQTYVAYESDAHTSIAQHSTGDLQIGSDNWKIGDNNGEIIHGATKTTFEKIIAIANKKIVPISLKATDGTIFPAFVLED